MKKKEKLNIETNDNHPMRITVTELMGVGKDEKIKLWFSETLLCTHHFFMLVCLYALLYTSYPQNNSTADVQ